MKTKASHRSLILTVVSAAALFVTVSARAGLVRTTAYLTNAGFRICKPETAEQRLLYSVAPSYRLLNAGGPWESLFAYKDEAAGVAYVGGAAAYRRFEEMARPEGFARGAYRPVDTELVPAWRWHNAFSVCLRAAGPELSPK